MMPFAAENETISAMKARTTLIVAGVLGLLAPSAVLTLMWYGVSGVLFVGHTYLGHVFWPSSIMLTGDWCCTLPGVLITTSSVAINCLLYMAFAYSLWAVARFLTAR
jgi:hypothetical protein